MKIQSKRLGEVEVPDERVLTFPESIPGFSARRFVVLPSKESALIEWLQAVDEPDLAFMLADPVKLVSDYDIKPRPAEMRPIKADVEPVDLVCRVIIRKADEPERIYLNLFAPVLINMSERLGMQIPLVGSGYGLREPWPAADGD